VALPRQWRHVQAMVARAEWRSALPDVSGGLLVAVGWSHDMSYVPRLASTGFHPGRRPVLRDQGAGVRLASLVVHGSCAVQEAHLRGLDEYCPPSSSGRIRRPTMRWSL
jgi:hypothetical protein